MNPICLATEDNFEHFARVLESAAADARRCVTTSVAVHVDDPGQLLWSVDILSESRYAVVAMIELHHDNLYVEVKFQEVRFFHRYRPPIASVSFSGLPMPYCRVRVATEGRNALVTFFGNHEGRNVYRDERPAPQVG